MSSSEVSDTHNDAFSGYTLIQAENLDQAVAYTKECPFVKDGGAMSVHEVMNMEANK